MRVNLLAPLVLLVVTFSTLLSIGPATAFGPLTATKTFVPKAPYNAACSIKVPPPIPDLAVQSYDTKIFVYTRYCATRVPSGQIRVQILQQFTNGFGGKGITVCNTNVWLAKDGTRLHKNVKITGIDSHADFIVADKFSMTEADFKNVRSWSWNFRKC